VKKILASLAGVAFLGITLLAADAANVRKAPELAFTIPSQGSKLLSQYRGKVVALEFIFTTCPHCQAASRFMTKLQNEYGARGLQVLDVAVNPNADLLVENFQKDFQTSFPVGWTPQSEMESFMGFSPGRFVVPQLVLIDRNGYIHYQTPATEDGNWDKLMKEDAIRQHVDELLSAGSTAQHDARRPSHVAMAKKSS
jgi:thiol-disulfide isomerase/thioredoxin